MSWFWRKHLPANATAPYVVGFTVAGKVAMFIAGALLAWAMYAGFAALDRAAARRIAEAARHADQCREMGGFPILSAGGQRLERCER